MSNDTNYRLIIDLSAENQSNRSCCALCELFGTSY